VLLVFVTPGMFGFHTYNGVGESMGDAIPSGSLIVTHSVSPEEIEIGDVITSRWPNFEYPITHRVIDIRSRGGYPVFLTQGDGNATHDPFVTVGTDDIGRVIFTAPRLGTWLPYAKALIYVLSFAGAVTLWRRWRQRRSSSPSPPAAG